MDHDMKKVPWNQSAFEALRATWLPERIAKEEQSLKQIFGLAAFSPTLKEALDWAEQHDIKFFIDRTAVNVGGFYTFGTGVVAIAARYAYPDPYAAQIIAHELRHAWQDYHGLVPCPGPASSEISEDFAQYFTKLSLIEADAYAIGKRAETECLVTQSERRSSQLRLFSLLSLDNKEDHFKNNFVSWFNSPSKTRFYGDFGSKLYGERWGVWTGELPERRCEFTTAPESWPKLEGIDTAHISNVLKLGESFSGQGNYLEGLPRELLFKQILAPSLAGTFYGAANDSQKQLTADIRKAYLRKKLKLSL
jgi:hypothetical protein